MAMCIISNEKTKKCSILIAKFGLSSPAKSRNMDLMPF